MAEFAFLVSAHDHSGLLAASEAWRMFDSVCRRERFSGASSHILETDLFARLLTQLDEVRASGAPSAAEQSANGVVVLLRVIYQLITRNDAADGEDRSTTPAGRDAMARPSFLVPFVGLVRPTLESVKNPPMDVVGDFPIPVESDLYAEALGLLLRLLAIVAEVYPLSVLRAGGLEALTLVARDLSPGGGLRAIVDRTPADVRSMQLTSATTVPPHDVAAQVRADERGGCIAFEGFEKGVRWKPTVLTRF